MAGLEATEARCHQRSTLGLASQNVSAMKPPQQWSTSGPIKAVVSPAVESANVELTSTSHESDKTASIVSRSNSRTFGGNNLRKNALKVQLSTE